MKLNHAFQPVKKLRIREYTDAELRDIELTTNDPLSVGRICEKPPDLGEELEFVQQYVTNEKLKCAFGHPHKHGFLMRSANGELHLIGRDCARSKYGIEWDVFVADVKRHIERKKSLVWVHRVSETILSLETELLQFSDDPAVRSFDELRKTLSYLPEDIHSACSTNGWLRGLCAERDFAAERKQKEKARAEYSRVTQNPSSSYEKKEAHRDLMAAEKPVYCFYEKNFMRAPCGLFKKNNNMKKRLLTLSRNLIGQANNLNIKSNFNHPKEIAKSINKSVKMFDEVLLDIVYADEFFKKGSITLFCEWLSTEKYKNYGVRQFTNGFQLTDQNGKVISVFKPDDLRPINFNLGSRIRT